MDQPPEFDLKRSTLSGLAWVAGGRFAQLVAIVGATAVLARLLTPADFGLLAMTAVFTGFAAVFVDLGLTAAVIQRPQLSEEHLSTAFWVNVVASSLLAVVLALLSPLVAALYGEPRLTPIMLVLALSFPFAGLAAVQVGLAERRMDFRRLAVVETCAVAVSFAAAIAAALAGLGVWSLVIQSVTQIGTRSLVLWWSSAWKPTRGFDRRAARELLGYGGHMAGFNALHYWIRSVDQFAVGAFSGAGQLGLYSRAYQLMLFPLSQVTAVSGRVMFPALSRLEASVERVRGAYVRAIALIALLSFPLMVILFVAAEPLILTVLGGQWTGAVSIFRVLCVVGLIQSVTATAGWLYQARGRTDWMLRWGLANGAVTLVAVAIGVHWGAIGVATAYAARTALLALPALAIPGGLIGLRLRDIGRTLRGVILASAALALLLGAVDALLPDAAPWAQLVFDLALGVALYVGLISLFRLDAYTEARSLIATEMLRRRSGEASE